MANWYDLLKQAMLKDGEDFDSCVCTMDENELKAEFNNGFGNVRSQPFLAWGVHWVYFALQYDGLSFVGHAPRNPTNQVLPHQGGRPALGEDD